MVVIKGGFRDRWTRQGLARQQGVPEVADGLETHHADECTDSMNSFDFLNPVEDGFDEGLSVGLDLQSQSDQTWDGPAKIPPPVLEPKPKSRPQVSTSESSISHGIKALQMSFLLFICIDVAT